jgi:hypothetical protein
MLSPNTNALVQCPSFKTIVNKDDGKENSIHAKKIKMQGFAKVECELK